MAASVAAPSPIVIPTSPSIVLPGGDPGFTQAPGSGIWLPTSPGLQRTTQPQLTVPQLGLPINADNMLAQAREGWATLAAADGDAAAQIAVGPQIAVIDKVAAEERHQAAVDAFWKGRRETKG